jgi:hypothetical protein
MTLTIKELGEEFDSLNERLETTADKMTNKLDSLTQGQNAAAVAAASLQTDFEALKQTIADASLKSLHTDVVSLKTTVANAKLVGVSAAIITALLGGAGIWQIVKTQFEVRDQQAHFIRSSEQASKLIAQHAQMMKEALIDRIENDLNSEASLDALKGKQQLIRIQANSRELEGLNESLPSNSKSNYYLVGRALTAFLSDNCSEVLRILDKINGADGDYYGIWYMRGACYLRTEKPDLARQAFATGAKLTFEGKRVQMMLNAQGVSDLQLWKIMIETRPQQATDALNEAIHQFEYLRKTYPNYVSAYVNLACAYAAQREFEKVSEVLAEFRAVSSPEVIVQYIQDDLNRPSEGYLTDYVREFLRIRSSTGDPHWGQDVIAKLPAAKLTVQ